MPRARHARSRRASKPASTNTTAGAHSPFAVESRRAMTATRTSPGSTVTTPPGFSAHAQGGPLLPRGGDRPALKAALLRARPSWPRPRARRPARSAPPIAGAGAGTHPLYVAGQGLSRRALQGRAAEPRSSSSLRSPGPTTSATSRSAPRSSRSRHRPGHGGLRSPATDHRRDPAADPLDPHQSRPTRTSPSTRPTATPFPSSPDRRQRRSGRGTRRALPGRQLRHPAVQPEAGAAIRRWHPAGKGSGTPCHPERRPRRSQHRPCRRRSPALGVSRQRPHQGAMHGCAVRSRRLSGGVGDRTRNCREPPARKAAGRTGADSQLGPSPAGPRDCASRTGPGRSRRPGQFRSRTPSGEFQGPPRCPDLASPPGSQGRQEGAARKQRKPLQGAAARPGQTGRPERQGAHRQRSRRRRMPARHARSANIPVALPSRVGEQGTQGCSSCQADPSGLPFVRPGAGCAERAGREPSSQARLRSPIGVLAAPVHGERAQSGSLIVYLRGGVSPRTLPRDHPTPVSVRLQAGIQTLNSVPLPRVKKIRLELAYRGALDTEGLPLCPPDPIARA